MLVPISVLNDESSVIASIREGEEKSIYDWTLEASFLFFFCSRVVTGFVERHAERRSWQKQDCLRSVEVLAAETLTLSIASCTSPNQETRSKPPERVLTEQIG